MFERFTDRARRVVVLAQEQARSLNHDYIGTEHLLLGLLSEARLYGYQGEAGAVLGSLGIGLDDARTEVEGAIGRGRQALLGHIPFTGAAKMLFEASLRESHELGHEYIGTGHLLLALFGEHESLATMVLAKLGVYGDQVRPQVVERFGQLAEGGPK